MRLLPVIMAMAVICIGRESAGTSMGHIEIAGEYRRDVIDYDDNPREFIRDRLSIDIGGNVNLFLAHSYIRTLEEHYFAWSLFIGDYIPKGTIIMGNFNLHCGSGLIAGVRHYDSPSPFASRPFPVSSFILKPSFSGSPLYSFHGIAASQGINVGDISCSLHAFYSMRPRYISGDEHEQGRAGSSLSTINGRTGRRYPFVEPVFIRNYGTVTELKETDSWTLQACYTGTALAGADGDKISWDCRGDSSSPTGVDDVAAVGLFFQYGDDYFNAFGEACMTGTSAAGKTGKNGSFTWEDGHAVSGGTRIRHPLFALACAFTMTGKNYYAPDSSRGISPRREWDTALSFRPLKGLEAGMGHSGERKNIPGLYEKDLRAKIRDRCYARWKNKKIESLLEVSWIEKEGSGYEKRELYGRIDISLSPVPWFRPEAGAQTFRCFTGGKTSWSAMTGFTLAPFDMITMAFSYVRVQAHDGAPLYIVVLPMQNALVSGINGRGRDNILVCRVALKPESGSLGLRYEQHVGDGGIGESRFEASGRLQW